MNMLKNIKASFDLKNSSLVNYLESSVDMLNSICCSRRSPNLQQLQSIIKLHEALDWDTPLDELESLSQFRKQEEAETSELLKMARAKLTEDLKRKEKELATLHSKRLAWLRGLHACARLLQTDLSPDKQKWVALRKKHLRQRLKERSLFKKEMLEAEIRGLERRLSEM